MTKLHENSTTETMLTPLENEKNVSRETIKEKTKERIKKPSKSYTIKSFAENIKKFKDFGWITNEEFVSLRELHLTAIKRYIEKDHGQQLEQIDKINNK